jgi:hypothetical protein
MIEAEPIGEIEHNVVCPHCRADLFHVSPVGQRATFPGFLYEDGDTIPIFSHLSEEQHKGFGWTTQLYSGTCPFCASRLIAIEAAFMDVEPDIDTEDVFFHRNGDRGEGANFLAKRGIDRWIVTRFDTPQGPMVEHSFGPFIDNYGEWVGPNSVASCAEGGPWQFATTFLLDRWDELRVFPKSIGLDPADPRAQSRLALETAGEVHEKEWRAHKAFRPPESDIRRHSGEPASQADDDIPF